MSNAVMQQIGTVGVIPIIVLNDVSKAVELARALLAGGIGCVEITLRTAVGIDAIHQIAQAVPEILIGAGTVLSIDQAEVAVAAGARFYCHTRF
ncbi:MAG: 2-dehydro-3-deoxyphosphogluconate aldolase/4- hydroxy-2-oxoglutarate aldolase [Chloroflexi bacterium OLB15]|nr:MAG: 2-dehydro-3-deoxyphosphogluconate aldolase/4- hydroxy-2-oxoglutarate aldolase [Chloroflexi bacterium OLB15]